MSTARKRRANGEESRRKIIEAATEIAGERGYEGTSISLVSERSGLPASSIYWHFADKDDLIGAVIQHSFEQWRALMAASSPVVDRSDPKAALAASMRTTSGALLAAPDFLRLGLMLALERRPEEPSARAMFLGVRRETRDDTARMYRDLFGDALDDAAAMTLAVMTVAAADGLFITREIDAEQIDIDEAFELVGVALGAVADHLIARRTAAQQRPARRAARDG